MQRRADQVRAIICLALGYYAAGRLGLMLAIPPGYATAVWPASGIALAGLLMTRDRAWLGIWLGSMAVNVTTGLDTTSVSAFLRSLVVPALIASGATLQAWVGKHLILRWVGVPEVMGDDTRIIRMLLVGGPLSCVISASIGIGSLAIKGLIPLQSIAFSWWTWWVGDSIGVLIFTPLLLIWLQGPLRLRLHRKVQISLIMATFFSVVVTLFIYSSRQEIQRLQNDFNRISDDAVTRFQRDLRDDWQALYSLAGFMQEGGRNWQDFEHFAFGQLSRIVGVKSLSWVPEVPLAARAGFERSMREQGFSNYVIRQQAAQGLLVPADERPLYAPVAYIVPLKGNEPALGFDDYSESIRSSVLARARSTGLPAASAAITLVQDGVRHRGMLMAVAARSQSGAITGYAIAAIRNDALIEASLGSLADAGVQLRINEGEGEASLQIYGPESPKVKGGMGRSLTVDVAGVKWHMDFSWTEDYLVGHRTWQAWTVLAAGMLFTGLLGMFLLLVIGRSERVQQLVDERTAELAREVERSAVLEQETRRHAQDLESSNRDLEQFAYAVSHDLQAPLRGISSFARLLEKRFEKNDRLDDGGREFIGLIRESAADMGRLIEDLLALSRVNAQRAEMGVIRTADTVKKACDLLRADIDASGAVIEQGDLPDVRGDARLLTQLFQNLIGNGIKFRREGLAPHIAVRTQMKDGEWLFEVRDNGIGIAPQHIPRLFQIFKRLHTQDQYPGSGIGLALCRKIVALHGGRIWMESEPGVGTRVYFTLVPAQGVVSVLRSAVEN